MNDRIIRLNAETGQPIVKVLSAARRSDRNIDELIGICKGIIADGTIVQSESEFLLNWMENNQDAAHQWPANILYERIGQYLLDGVLDPDESNELIELLKKITGGEKIAEEVQSMASSLPLDIPAPDIIFKGSIFCLTGTFTVGSRDKVTKLIEEKGGACVKSPTFETDYLIIGLIGSRDWIHSTHGRKIEAAVNNKEDGKSNISIISEEHWIKFI